MGARLFSDAERALRLREVTQALKTYYDAERAGFDSDLCAAGRWTGYMLLGDFEQAWRESDGISQRGNPDRHRYWNGQKLDGRSVIVRCLHGLGDTLQFVRYAPIVRKRAQSLIIEAQPSLKTLLTEAGLADEVIQWGEPEPFWDQQIEVIELPRIFRTTIDTIPAEVPYIRLGSRHETTENEYDGSRPLRVGINWAAGEYNPARSMQLEEMAELASIRNVILYSLQAGPERKQLRSSGRIQDICDESGCLMAVGRTLANVDLVVTVDTMLAHLAGALAKPVWTLLPYEGDWRWMLDRDDSPWYPSMRLFRQALPGAWKPVVEAVGIQMAAVASGHAPLSTRMKSLPAYSGLSGEPGRAT
jgi:hypothetical protein